MENIQPNPIPGTTVRQFIDGLCGNGYSGTITIDRVYYNFHDLVIAPPDWLDLDAVVTALDYGYYGNPGILTK